MLVMAQPTTSTFVFVMMVRRKQYRREIAAFQMCYIYALACSSVADSTFATVSVATVVQPSSHPSAIPIFGDRNRILSCKLCDKFTAVIPRE